MKLRSAMAILALLTLAPVGPAAAAKDDKLPRCSGKSKRPANLYGTVLPTIPPREGVTSSNGGPSVGPASQRGLTEPPRNLFPEPSGGPVGAAPASETKVPAIGPATPGPARISAVPVSYGSC